MNAVNRARFAAAITFPDFLAMAVENGDLWRATARRAAVAPELVARATTLPGRWRLLALAEDWCGDGVNTLPYVARLAELAPDVELRIAMREAHPELMDAHRTNGSRSIPIVIAYDGEFTERAWWGPRPTTLQTWVLGPGRLLEKAERYREVRRWYARDQGRAALEELLAMLKRVATLPASAWSPPTQVLTSSD